MRTTTTDDRTMFIELRPRSTQRRVGKRRTAAVKPKDCECRIALRSHHGIVSESIEDGIVRENAKRDLLETVLPGVLDELQMEMDCRVKWFEAKRRQDGAVAGAYFKVYGSAHINADIYITILDNEGD